MFGKINKRRSTEPFIDTNMPQQSFQNEQSPHDFVNIPKPTIKKNSFRANQMNTNTIDRKLDRKQTTPKNNKQRSYCELQKNSICGTIQTKTFGQSLNNSCKNTPKKTSKTQQQQNHSEIQERFQQIEQVMGIENQNLREQKNYLLETITKMQIRQKQFKKQIMNLRVRNTQLEDENVLIRKKYEQARRFLNSGIDKMQQAISNSPFDGSLQTTAHSNENTDNLQSKIQELNQKFQTLLNEYNITRNYETRRMCMDIAKNLKRLRKEQNSHFPICLKRQV